MEKMAATVSSQVTRLNWLKLFLVGIVLLAVFLRLYKISDYMTFLGDEGRDVLIVKHLLEGDLVGLGPTASVGGFFTGPIYYYFMAPFLWLFRLNPVGPAVMVALFGIATVFLVYLAGKIFFNEKAGLIAAALYTVSPLIIAYSRSSWNPNPLPFFSLLAILTIYKGVKDKKWRYFIFTGIMLGITLQLHYIASFLATSIIFYLFVRLYFVKDLSLVKRLLGLVREYVAISFGFLIGYSPFLAFEATHSFPNTRTIFNFVFGGTGETGFTGEKFWDIVTNVFFRLFARLVTRFPPPEQVNVSMHSNITLWYWLTVFLAVCSIAIIIWQFCEALRKNHTSSFGLLLVIIWFLVGIFLFGFYKKPIYDYYFGFMYPLPFLLVGNLISFLNIKLRWGGLLAIIIFVALFLFNLDGMPFKYLPNRQLAQVGAISQFVLEKIEGGPFNFALITGGNSDHAYRYFFELAGRPPVTIENEINDPKRKTVTDQLLVICEDPNCKPLGHPLWEVAGFGMAEIIGEWDVSVVKVYKLIHNKGS